ncbi:unnamed protein product [Toxocara canis]|uniref:DUF202 domain-containing protein n=1 Tax=Toxocara canis TaxID=6265 RepID=A0A183VFW8_TOXCA|nr:unnamed protein product [Toxocara canis]
MSSVNQFEKDHFDHQAAKAENCSHTLRQNAVIDERRLRAFETGSRYHLLHSVALLGCGRAWLPLLTASLFFAAITAFSSTCYH